jgi:hypothetical protein
VKNLVERDQGATGLIKQEGAVLSALLDRSGQKKAPPARSQSKEESSQGETIDSS